MALVALVALALLVWTGRSGDESRPVALDRHPLAAMLPGQAELGRYDNLGRAQFEVESHQLTLLWASPDELPEVVDALRTRLAGGDLRIDLARAVETAAGGTTRGHLLGGCLLGECGPGGVFVDYQIGSAPLRDPRITAALAPIGTRTYIRASITHIEAGSATR